MATSSKSIRDLANSLWELDRRLTGVERTPQMGYTSLDNTGLNVYDSEGNLSAVIGRQDDGSFGHRVVEGPTPAAPSNITAEPGLGNLSVTWNGTFAGGVDAPRDFSIVAIHASESPDFEASAENTVATISFPEAATRVLPLKAGTYYLKATTLSLADKRSEATEEVEAEAGPLVDEDSIQEALDQARTEREQAAQQAQEALSELEDKLNNMEWDDSALDEIRDAIAAAQEAVESAQSTASEAVTAANAASQAALEAAGIAASKGQVLVQETEPQGDDRKSSNIWIQPVEDDPTTEVEEKAVTYVYLEASDDWVPTTSSELAQAAQNALDAREAAQQAQQRADTAIANASAAQATAQAAKSSADGKNTIRFSFSDPTSSSPGERPGDTWWRANTDGNIIGQWTWNGTEWDPVQLRSEVIANLDVSKLSVHDSATINEAVIGRLFTDIFTAHKITATELTIASVKGDGTLSDDSVTSVTIKDGAVNADKLTADSVTAEKIAAGAIETGHMSANSIDGDVIKVNTLSGDRIEANTISAEKISGGSFEGKTFTGGLFAGAEFQSPATPRWNGGIAISPGAGIQGWDYAANPSNPKKILQIGAPSMGNFMSGTISTGADGEAAAILTPVKGGGKTGGGIWFSSDGSLGNDQAAIYSYLDGNIHIRPKDNVPKGTVFIDGNLNVGSRTWFQNQVEVGGIKSNDNVVVGGPTARRSVVIYGDIRATHPGSDSSSANAVYMGDGQIVIQKSSRRYKKNIADWNPEAERVLALQPRQWQHSDPTQPGQPSNLSELWHVGFIAEEVDELGLNLLVKYEGDGKGGWRPESLNYDRFAAAHQVVLQKHEQQITDLESANEELRSENAELRDRLAAIEAKLATL